MPFGTNFKRILRSGLTDFWRNSFVSLASIMVLTITLFIIGALMFLNGLVGNFISYVKDKVDVNVYFSTTAPEDAILAVQKDLEALPEVASVTYTSRDEALTAFKARHQDDQLTLQALNELSDNPLGATFAIKAKDPSQYESIAQFLDARSQNADGTALIDKVNYAQNKTIIDQLNKIIKYVGRLGVFIIAIFSIASILITFNTIRLAIYTSREEISVMRLVGASNAYIRGPFVFEGMLYGIIAAAITLAAFYPITWWLRTTTLTVFNGDIFSYYASQFLVFFAVLVGSGVVLGALSSWLAVRKYLTA